MSTLASAQKDSFFSTLVQFLARKLDGAPNALDSMSLTHALHPGVYGRPEASAFADAVKNAESGLPGHQLLGIALWGEAGTPSRVVQENVADVDFPTIEDVEKLGKDTVLRAEWLMAGPDGKLKTISTRVELDAESRDQNDATPFALWAIAQKISLSCAGVNKNPMDKWNWCSAKSESMEAFTIVSGERFTEKWREEALGREQSLKGVPNRASRVEAPANVSFEQAQRAVGGLLARAIAQKLAADAPIAEQSESARQEQALKELFPESRIESAKAILSQRNFGAALRKSRMESASQSGEAALSAQDKKRPLP